MPYISRDGVAVYYEVHGAGPVILLTHGFAATARMWSRQMEVLTRGRRVVVWDMRGHGRTDSPEDPALYSEDATVGDMLAILNAVGSQRAIVGGHSLGGYMSLAFHRRYPERVAALLLCGTGPGFRKEQARDAWNARAVGIGEGIERNGLADLNRFSAEMEPSDHKSVQGLVKAARGMLTQRDGDVIDSLSKINVPTLVTVGSEDQGYLVGTQYLASKIAAADYAVFDGAGHAANLDNASEFNAVLAHFLDTRVAPLG